MNMYMQQAYEEKMERTKEENAIILDFLPNGYPFDERPMYMKTPVAQALGNEHFILLELVPKKGMHLQLYEEVYIGKKHMWEIINAREEKPFESFEDIRKRVKLIPDPEKLIIKRILEELEGTEKHKLFVDIF